MESLDQSKKPSIYVLGKPRVDVPDQPSPLPQGVSTRVDPGSTPPAKVTDETLGTTQSELNRARGESERDKEESSAWDSIGAAVATWDTTRILDKIQRPTFSTSTPVENVTEYLENVGMTLNPDERDYILSMSQSQESLDYAINYVRDQQRARGIAGENPTVAMLMSFLDPAYLALPAGIGIGRAASAVAMGGVTAAMGNMVEGTLSDEELTRRILLNSGLGAVFGKVKGKGPSSNLVKEKPPKDISNEVVEKAIVPSKPPEGLAKRVGQAISLNIHKEMSKFGDVGKKLADILFDNNSNLGLQSVESYREAAKGTLVQYQMKFEQVMLEAMAERGFGTVSMILPWKARKAYQVQREIEEQVAREMARRETLYRQGVTDFTNPDIPKKISELADSLAELNAKALDLSNAAGVKGAAGISKNPGYTRRIWDSTKMQNLIDDMVSSGLTLTQAKKNLAKVIAAAYLKANPNGNAKAALLMSKGIVDRTLKKGYFEDVLSNEGLQGAGWRSSMEDAMKAAGISKEQIDDAMRSLTGEIEEGGKSSFWKNRVDLDADASITLNNKQVSFLDMVDTRITTTTDNYIQHVSTDIGLAKAGIKDQNALVKMREDLLHSIADPKQREKAKDLFDNTIAHLKGLPTGGQVPDMVRGLNNYNRMITLGLSGLWQLTEYSTAMQKFGLANTLKYAMAEIPGLRKLMHPNTADAGTLAKVLSDQSAQSVRMRPYLAKFEDGFSMSTANGYHLAAQAGSNMLPMVNTMKYIHHHQARMVGNLMQDVVEKAAKGDSKALSRLSKYGMTDEIMAGVRAEIKEHGMQVDKWSDSNWLQANTVFSKMVDEVVLKGRMGDKPSWILFNPVGKTLFMYKDFVMTAHNKTLAGTLQRDGAKAVGLMLMYQMPLTYLAVSARAAMAGDKKSQDELLTDAVSYMGTIGLFSEVAGIATGGSGSWFASVGIPLNRASNLAASIPEAIQGDPSRTGGTLLQMIPLISALPFMSGVAKRVREMED
jgi:hypothetical protein